MTYRERRQARAVRLQEYANKREAKADAAYTSAMNTIDGIPPGQPILVGHHSERKHRKTLERHDNYMRRSIGDSKKAEEMRSKAVNILEAADDAIYSDDPDAIERLQAKLDGLEAERESIKAYNTSCRKGCPDLTLLTPKWRNVIETYRHSFATKEWLAKPVLGLSGINGNINRTKKRLAALERRAA